MSTPSNLSLDAPLNSSSKRLALGLLLMFSLASVSVKVFGQEHSKQDTIQVAIATQGNEATPTRNTSREEASGQKLQPLTKPQIAAISNLLRTTRGMDEQLKAELLAQQNRLTELYINFQLDPTQVAAVQQEILTTQSELLKNHHRLNVKVREIVGEKRFASIWRRITYVPKKKPAKEKNTPYTRKQK